MGYAIAFFNKKHTTGGLFQETGGSLRKKTIGNFGKVGLNGCVMKNSKPLVLKPVGKLGEMLTVKGPGEGDDEEEGEGEGDE